MSVARAWLLTGGLCLLGGLLAFALVGDGIAPLLFWPPAGIALGAVVLWGWRVAPAALLATALAGILAGLTWSQALALGLAVIAQALVGAWLLGKAGFPRSLGDPAALGKLVLFGGLAAGLVAAPATHYAMLALDGYWEASLAQRGSALLFSHLASALVFAPPLICWFAPTCPRRRGRGREIALALAGFVTLSLMLTQPHWFGLQTGAFRPYPLLPFLLWLALRADARITALSLAWMYGVSAGTPGWARGDLFALYADDVVMPIHGFVSVVGLSFMTLAVLTLQRNRSDAALRQSEARFQNILGMTRNCMWETDAMGRFVFVGQNAMTLLGKPADALLAHTPEELWSNGWGDACRDLLRRASHADTPLHAIDAFRDADGRMRYLETSCVVLRDERGETIGWQGITRDVTEHKLAEQARLDAALAQRDTLIREVHHRIKNNLQTVVSLLRREAGKHPEARGVIDAAIAQVRSVAVVHGLHGQVTHSIMLCELLPAIVASVAELTGVDIQRVGVAEGAGNLRLKENETVAVALILNELVANAVKHLPATAASEKPLVDIRRDGMRALIRIANPGTLPPAFDFARGIGLGTGLGLVRALLPRAGMTLSFAQRQGSVVVEVEITPPVLNVLDREEGDRHEERIAGG